MSSRRPARAPRVVARKGDPLDEGKRTIELERAATATDEVVRAIGTRIRSRREQLDLSLRDVAGETGLSVSMVSLAERGRTVPSIGTLMAICDALRLPMSQLFAPAQDPPYPIIRRAHQSVHPTSGGMTRRIIFYDPDMSLEVTEHEYTRGGTSSSVPTHHSGREVGVVIEGQLTVELGGNAFVLTAGDCVRYDSIVPHRFISWSRGRTRAIWLNYRGRAVDASGGPREALQSEEEGGRA